MSDDKKDDAAAAAFKYTAPTDKSCFNTVVMYKAKDCKEADKSANAKLTDPGKMEAYVVLTAEDGKTETNWAIKTCDGKSIVMWPAIAGSKAQTAKDLDDTENKAGKEKAVTFAVEEQAKKDGTSGCVEVETGKLWATMKVSGYAKEGDSSSGAKTLGAAFAAGALAVAATQF